MLAALLGGSEKAAAQPCLGVSADDGHAFFTFAVSITEDVWAPSGTFGYNSRGPFTVAIGYERTVTDVGNDIDPSAFTGDVYYELRKAGLSLCPRVFLGLRTSGVAVVGGSGGPSELSYGGGFSLGGQLGDRRSFALIPSAGAMIIYNSTLLSIGAVAAAWDETFASFTGSLALATGVVYLAPRVSIATLGGSDPVYTVALGLVF